MRLLLAIILCIVALNAQAATLWYVDADATGADNGTNWANAWPELTNIVWGGVSPGDTIYLSGGTYTGVMSLDADGTEGNPITVKKSQEVGHTDLALLNGRIKSGAEWVTIDGADDDSYTNNVTYTYSVLDVTNNTGFKIDSSSLEEHGINLFGAGPVGIVLKWLDVTTGTNTPTSKDGAIRINASDMTDTEIAYCWLHDTTADGIWQSQDDVWETDSILIHHNLVENIGDDGIVHNGGCNMYNNIVRNTLELSGHPDGIVGLAHNTTIANNIVYDWNTQPLYPGISRVDFSNFFMYGNLVYSEDFPTSQENAALITVDANFPWFEGGVYTTNAFWKNVVIVHNTFVAGRQITDVMNIANRFSPDSKPGEPGLVVTNLEWIVKNNILIGGKSFGLNLKGQDGPGWFYEDADMIVENNVIHSLITDGNRIQYKAADYYLDVPAFEAATSATGNTSNAPVFIDFEGRDFRLDPSDTAAIGQGQDLSALTLAGLDTDLWGNSRSDGGWDIGAIAYTLTNDLLLHLTFEDDFVGNGFAADSSGNAAHMLRYGWSDPTTNFPTVGTGKVGDQSAAFLPYYDSHPYADTNFNDGQYGAITNLGSLLTLTTATFTAWVKFADTGVGNNTLNHNASFLTTGYNTSNTWRWGRYYSTTFGEPQFNIQTNLGGGADASSRNKWPQVTADYWYTNSVWQHLAATVDCTTSTQLVVRLLTDGAVVTSNQVSLFPANAVPFLRITDAPGSNWGEWIGVGCWTHNGTPPLTNGTTPNNGWLNGNLDDIRIYNRVLSDVEIQNIAEVAPAAKAPDNLSGPQARGGFRR